MKINTTRNQAEILDTIPASLPLLGFVDNIHSLEHKLPFLGYKILAVQHLIGASIPFFAMFEKGGAKPEDIYLIGKAYSSHPEVVKCLQQKGYNLTFNEIFDCAFDQPYDSILQKRIVDFAITLLEKTDVNQKWLIIDDGAKAIELLHLKYSKLASNFACVEQTSRGTRTVKKLTLACPVIDVARSEAKTIHEAPMIAQAMVDEFLNALQHWKEAQAYHLTDKNVLLLGYGFIGENVATRLFDYGFSISVYDTDNDKLQQAQQAGLTTVNQLDEIYHKVNIVAGCSGTPVLTDQEFSKLKPGTLLVNMASTDMEFSAWKLRPKGTIIHQHVLPVDLQYLKELMPLPWRSLYKVQLAETYLYLANGGFPMDFSGKINPVPSNDIQFTSALLLAGAIQAVGEKEAKLIELNPTLQNKIIAAYSNLKTCAKS